MWTSDTFLGNSKTKFSVLMCWKTLRIQNRTVVLYLWASMTRHNDVFIPGSFCNMIKVRTQTQEPTQNCIYYKLLP